MLDGIEPGSTLAFPPGIRLEHTRAVEVRRNVVPFADHRDMAGVGLFHGSQAVIECNHFRGAALVSSADATSDASERDNAVGDTAPDCARD